MKKRKDVFVRNLHRHANARQAMKAVSDHAQNRTDTPLAAGSAGLAIDKMANNPLIAERMRNLLEEEAREAIAEAAKDKEVTLYGIARKRAILSRMMDGDWIVKKHVRMGNVLVESYEGLTPTELFRAMDLDAKFAGMMLKMQGLDDMLSDVRITVPGRNINPPIPELDALPPIEGEDPYRYNEAQRYQHASDALEEERPIPESLRPQKPNPSAYSVPPHPAATPVADILNAAQYAYPPTVEIPEARPANTAQQDDDLQEYAKWGANLPDYDPEVGRRTRENGGFMPIADKLRLFENREIEERLREGAGDPDDLDDYLRRNFTE